MTFFEAMVLAAVQGVTEFLPVSSSGHMVLFKVLLDVETPGVLWETALHVGTLLAVVILFRREIAQTVGGFLGGLRGVARGGGWRRTWQERPCFRTGWYIIVGSAPAAVFGLTMKSTLEALFSNGIVAMIMLFLTGEILWLTRHHSCFAPRGRVRLSDSIVIGIVQALALFPGISRSGSTIAAGLLRGVKRDEAAGFSFLLAIPAIVGASALEIRHICVVPAGELPVLALAVAAAGLVGYGALRLLLSVVRAGRLYWFAYYCWAVSILGVTLCWAKQCA